MNQPSDFKLDQIQDPKTGLALLAKCSGEETPAQESKRLFWQFQFVQWQAWRDGDAGAVSRALTICRMLREPPPRWLWDATHQLYERCVTDAEKRELGDVRKHFLRWKAVELVRGRRRGDPRNFKRKVRPDAVWAEAAKLVAGTDAKAGDQAVRKSHALIKRAGGALVTLPSYRREVAKRDRRSQKI